MDAPKAEEVQGISFDVALKLQNYRLIELSPEIQQHLSSDDPSILQLKSVPYSDNSINDIPSAFLCTESKTFEVRQVHSSNVLHVLQTSDLEPDNDMKNVAHTGLTSIAQCKVMLELVPSKNSAQDHLLKILPLYNGGEESPPATQVNESQLIADSPFSTRELEDAKRQLCVIQTETGVQIPTPSVLYKLWESVFLAVTIKGIDLLGPFLTDDVKTLVTEDGHLVEVLEAVCTRLQSLDSDNMTNFVSIDSQQCVSWVGNMLLASHGSKASTETTLLQQWRDVLPESWREDVSLAKLEGLYKQLSDNGIVSTHPLLERIQVLGSAPEPTPVARPLSKWHEKFKASRD